MTNPPPPRMVPSVVQSITDSRVLGSTRPTGNLLTTTLFKPMLASVEEDAVAEFLRLDFEYRSQAARHGVEPDGLRTLIDPAYHSVIEDLAEHYGIEIPYLSNLSIAVDVEHDMATLAYTVDEWNRLARQTLQLLVSDESREPTVDEAKAHLTKVKWNARLKSFKSTLHTYMAHYRQSVRQYHLQNVIDNNGRQIVRHLIDQLYPEAFKRKIAAENLQRGKLTTPSELFSLLNELEPHYEGAIDQLRIQRENTRSASNTSAKPAWDARTPRPASQTAASHTNFTARKSDTTWTTKNHKQLAHSTRHTLRRLLVHHLTARDQHNIHSQYVSASQQ